MAAAMAGVISPNRASAKTMPMGPMMMSEFLAFTMQGVFSGGPVIRACLEHGGGGDAVGAYGVQLQFRMLFLQLFYNGFSHTAALAVDNGDFHASPPAATGWLPQRVPAICP